MNLPDTHLKQTTKKNYFYNQRKQSKITDKYFDNCKLFNFTVDSYEQDSW